MAARIPRTEDDIELRRRVLLCIVAAAGSQAEAARLFGVGEPAISQWIHRKREVEEWPVLLAAMRAAALRFPEHQATLIEGFALEVFDARGTWTPDVEPSGKQLAEESADVTVAQGEVLRMARSGDPEACAAAGRSLVREAVELASAVRRSA